METRNSIIELAGAWNNLSEEDAKKIKISIRERRKDRSRMEELHKKFIK